MPATDPLSEASLFHEVLAAMGHEPLLAFLVGALLAWVFHSTLAVILLIASFLANGSLEVAGALSFILGINFGGGLPAVTVNACLARRGRRLPLANLFCRAFMAVAGLALINRLTPYVVLMPLRAVETAVAFHTAFNIVRA